MTLNLTIRLLLMVPLINYFWVITFDGSHSRDLALTNVTLEQLRQIDAREVLRQAYENPDAVSSTLVAQAYVYRAIPHSFDLSLKENLELMKFRLCFAPRLAALPALSAFGRTVAILIPSLRDDTDMTGYNTGVLVATSLAIPCAILCLFGQHRRPMLAAVVWLVAAFLLMQLAREYLIGTPLFFIAPLFALPTMTFAAWKLLALYSRT